MRADKLNQFLLKLIKLTGSGELNWEGVQPVSQELPNGDTILGKMYVTTIDSRKFWLYSANNKSFEIPQNNDYVRLEMRDNRGSIDYVFEHSHAMYDLYRVVIESTSNINSILDEILTEEIKILSASYFTTDSSIDVTEALRNRVVAGRLHIIITNELAGDPQPGVKKNLKIKYKSGGLTREKSFIEGEIISLP